jgi:hypothetical protein
MTLSGELSAKPECRVGCQLGGRGMGWDVRKRVMQDARGYASVYEVPQINGGFKNEEKGWGNRYDISIGNQDGTSDDGRKPQEP